MNDLPHILVVDDEPLNIEIITELLEDLGAYQISTAEDGEIAIAMLEENPEDYDVILLDRMMPNLNGMDVLARIKQHQILRQCPVIFQTAKSSSIEISEGLKAGAHYYLTKPFQEEVLLSVVKTAVADRLRFKALQSDLNTSQNLMGLLRTACFEFKSLSEARNLASLLSHVFPDPGSIILGLTELMVNAVEHGNLAITYDEKSTLNEQGTWTEEVERRLKLPENFDKRVVLNFESTDDALIVTIKDEGDGFDWQNYLDFDPERVMDNHGRGIAVANQISFSEVEYRGNGNEVCARVKST